MAVIDNFRGILTVFSEYFSEGSSSKELLEELEPIFSNHIKGYPGLVSYNLHISIETDSVFNYFQWKDDDSYQKFCEDETIRKMFLEISGFNDKSFKTKVVLAS
ncbi:MAG: hypothetical protein CME70_14670 [Halobacteriovorax sp.]|nr:hypothetical protein [Halobacteriovorax sp.]|tara:strand:- start:196763 stop:197074 length:312 start_codon:yes stop_codon:yes gene_type:complete